MIRVSIFSRLFSTIESATITSEEQIKKRARRLIKTDDLQKRQPMNSSVFAVCTAESYDLVSMAKKLKGLPSMIQNRDVLHFREEASDQNNAGIDCFFFRHGSFVLWKNDNVDTTVANRFRDLAAPFEKTSLPVEKQETEEIPFK